MERECLIRWGAGAVAGNNEHLVGRGSGVRECRDLSTYLSCGSAADPCDVEARSDVAVDRHVVLARVSPPGGGVGSAASQRPVGVHDGEVVASDAARTVGGVRATGGVGPARRVRTPDGPKARLEDIGAADGVVSDVPATDVVVPDVDTPDGVVHELPR